MAKGRRNNNSTIDKNAVVRTEPPRPTLNSNAIEEVQAQVTPVKMGQGLYKKEVSNTDSGVFEEAASSGAGSPDKLTTANLRINNKKFDLEELDLVAESLASEDTDIEIASSETGLEFQDEEVDIFEEPTPDPSTLKLHTPWTMYFVTKSKSGKIMMKDYKDGRQPYPRIETVADFWAQLNNIPLPKELRVDHREDLYFFRENIQPEWEDPMNTSGGMWRLELSKKEHRNDLINILWYELLMALVGEQFTDASQINGCIFQRRQREDRIQLWTRSLDGKNAIKKLMAEEFRKFLSIDVELQYISHAESRSAQNGGWSNGGGKNGGGGGNRGSKSQGHKSKQQSVPQAGTVTLMKRGSTIEPSYMKSNE